MSKNKVQFQKGMSLSDFLALYGTEVQCEQALFAWRWPHGFILKASFDGMQFVRESGRLRFLRH